MTVFSSDDFLPNPLPRLILQSPPVIRPRSLVHHLADTGIPTFCSGPPFLMSKKMKKAVMRARSVASCSVFLYKIVFRFVLRPFLPHASQFTHFSTTRVLSDARLGTSRDSPMMSRRRLRVSKVSTLSISRSSSSSRRRVSSSRPRCVLACNRITRPRPKPPLFFVSSPFVSHERSARPSTRRSSRAVPPPSQVSRSRRTSPRASK